MREYIGLDAQRCWAMGYLLDLDCAEVDKEQIDVCVVDCLVLQLVSILFANHGVDLPAKLVALQRHCTTAFTRSFKGKKDLNLFADAEYHLTRPYSWTNEDHRNRVRKYANSLSWLLFGMTEEQESDELA